jgi:hypothetical protein
MKINLILILLSCFLHLCASNLNTQIQEIEKTYGNNLLKALNFVVKNNRVTNYTVDDVRKWLQDKYTKTQNKNDFFSQMFTNETSIKSQNLSDDEFKLLQQITTNYNK